MKDKRKPRFCSTREWNTSQFFDFVLAEFATSSEAHNEGQQLMRLNQWPLDRYRAGQTAVLIIDVPRT
jgi:hypothetical protein